MRDLKHALLALIALTAACGLVYPLVMTGAAQVVYPGKADGSPDLIARPGGFFKPRPSVTGYAADATAFNNQGPNQDELAGRLKGYVATYLAREGRYTPGLTAARIPVDAVTTSASGVDPDISDDNARIQANRVAVRAGVPRREVLALIEDGTSRGSVNVNRLNRELEARR